MALNASLAPNMHITFKLFWAGLLWKPACLLLHKHVLNNPLGFFLSLTVNVWNYPFPAKLKLSTYCLSIENYILTLSCYAVGLDWHYTMEDTQIKTLIFRKKGLLFP